jgi:hypothetical protein
MSQSPEVSLNTHHGHIFNKPEYPDMTVYAKIRCSLCGQNAKQLKWKSTDVVYYDEEWNRLFDTSTGNNTIVFCGAKKAIKEEVKPPLEIFSPVNTEVKFTNRHRFKVESTAPNGDIYKKCDCGLKMMVYVKTKSMAYFGANGAKTNMVPNGCPNDNKKPVVEVEKRHYTPRKSEIHNSKADNTHIITEKPAVEKAIEPAGKIMQMELELIKPVQSVDLDFTIGDLKAVQPEQEPPAEYNWPKSNHEEKMLEDFSNNILKSNDSILGKDFKKALPSLSKLTGDEARLVEAYVVINLMYEDMVKKDIYCESRDIAGRLLYSSSYAEKVRELNKSKQLI